MAISFKGEQTWRDLEVITYEEYSADIHEMIKMQRDVLEVATLRALATEEARWEEEMERYTTAIEYNLFVLEFAKMYKDYLIFYRDDGNPTYVIMRPSLRNKILNTMRERDRLYA